MSDRAANAARVAGTVFAVNRDATERVIGAVVQDLKDKIRTEQIGRLRAERRAERAEAALAALDGGGGAAAGGAKGGGVGSSGHGRGSTAGAAAAAAAAAGARAAATPPPPGPSPTDAATRNPAAQVADLQARLADSEATVAALTRALDAAQTRCAHLERALESYVLPVARRADSRGARASASSVGQVTRSHAHRGRWSGYGPWGHWTCCGSNNRLAPGCTS